jgi:hypothetical protein
MRNPRFTLRCSGGCAASLSVLVLASLLLLFDGPASADGFKKPRLTLATEDGSTSIEFHLAAQLRWEYLFVDNGPDKDRSTTSKLMFRRIRPVIQGTLLTEKLKYNIHLNLVPGQIELMDLFFEYSFHPLLRIMVGQYKIPFTRYRINSFQDTPVVEWSHPTRWIGAERQYGVMLHNGLKEGPVIEYQLGVFSGINARASNAIGVSKFYTETPPNPSDLDDPDPLGRPHGELVAHVAWNYGGINVGRPSDLEASPPGFSAGFSAAWDFQPTPLQDARLRLAPEFLLKAHGFMLQGVFYLVFWDKAAEHDQGDLGIVGGVLQTSYVIKQRYEIALRYTNLTFMKPMRDDARAYGNARIAGAETAEEQDALVQKYRSNGVTRTEHELNLGFNVYIFGTSFKWMVDAGVLMHERVDHFRYDVQLRTQFQLTF